MSRNFNHFPNLSKRINTLPGITIKDHKPEEHRDKLQGLFDIFLFRSHSLQKTKPASVFLVNPITVDMVNVSKLILNSLATDSFLYCGNETNGITERTRSNTDL